MAMKQWFNKVVLFACFLALTVIALGAFTRLMDAGLGCPDWPLCDGHVMPQGALDHYKAWAEMIHRYFAGILSFLILCVIVLSFIRPVRSRFHIISAILLIFLILYQIILGQLTVTLKLMPLIVVGHLLGGFLILTTLWLIYFNSRYSARIHLKIPGLIEFTLIALILLFLQICLGALTSTNYAALSCPDFPFCQNDQPFFTMDFKNAFQIFSTAGVNYEGGLLTDVARQTLQMTHRMGAFIVTLYLFVFTWFSGSKIKNHRVLVNLTYIIWGFLSLQLFLGIINVVFKLPIFTAVLHTLVAILLLLSLSTFLYCLISMRRKVT